MKLVTRIGLGYALLIALLVATLAYQVTLIQRIQSISRELSEINVNAVRVSIRLYRDLDPVEEFATKYFVLGDEVYRVQWREWEELFARDLLEINSLALSPLERAELKRLVSLWDDYLEIGRRHEDTVEGSLPRELEVAFFRLRRQVERLIDTTNRVVAVRADQSAAVGQRGEAVSWTAALTALGLSLLVSLLIFRSISRPLGRLTRGTHELAQGRFSYRLPAGGGDELAQLARDFNAMARRLDELDEMKSDFVSHVSHELKAPLASIQETTLLLLDRLPGELSPKQRRLLELNLKSARRLSTMIENLLDLSRMEANVIRYDVEPHDLKELIGKAMDETEALLLEKRLRIDAVIPDEPLLLRCDGDRIIQLLVNLLGNAIKFAPPETGIEIRLEAAESLPPKLPSRYREPLSCTEGAFPMISVIDAGPGVEDAHKEKIFEKFHQVRRGSKIAGQGTGLGLAISRTIAEAHGAALWVEDGPAGGAVFRLLFPPHRRVESVLESASESRTA